jgi:hypothetical protein
MRPPDASLTPDQAADAGRIYQALCRASEDDHCRITLVLASQGDVNYVAYRDVYRRLALEA